MNSTNWTINENNFQKMYELFDNRLKQVQPLTSPIPEDLAMRMIDLATDLKKTFKSSIKEFYKLPKSCLDEIVKKEVTTLSLHLIQIEDITSLGDENIGDIKNNDVQFAVSFDDQYNYFLICDVPQLVDISKNFLQYKKSFTKNITPEIDKHIVGLTGGIKTENTTTIYIPVDSLKKFSKDIYIHPAVVDANPDNVFHSITHLYNFTVVASDTDLTKKTETSVALVLEDVYRTCKPYCSGTGGGII